MKTIISIDDNIFTDDDILILNSQSDNKKIEFTTINSQGFIEPEIILILVELSKNIGYMAAYDTLKYALCNIFNLFSKKVSEKSSKESKKFEIICNGKSYTVFYDFPLNEEQKNKLIETASKKILDE